MVCQNEDVDLEFQGASVMCKDVELEFVGVRFMRAQAEFQST